MKEKTFVKICCGILALIVVIQTAILVNAEIQSLGTSKQNECIQLVQVCSSCSYVTLSSVTYPNSDYALRAEYPMTKSGITYNYTFCDTSNLGIYSYCIHGDVDGTDIPACVSFEVTPAGGAENNTTLFIMLAIIALVLLLLAFIFKNYIFSIISGFAILVAGVYSMAFGFGGITNIYTRMISIIIIGLGMIITIVSSFDLINESEEGNVGYSEEDLEDED